MMRACLGILFLSLTALAQAGEAVPTAQDPVLEARLNHLAKRGSDRSVVIEIYKVHDGPHRLRGAA